MKTCLKYYLLLLFCVTIIEGSFRCDYKYSMVAKGWFKHFIVPATWFDARLRCALEGAVLASPTTPEIKAEMTNIFNPIETQQQYEVFTGIHANFAKGAYHTIEGTPLSKIHQTWAPNEPDNKNNKESCLTLNSNGDLADLSCEETRPFFCYRSESNEEKFNECGTVDPVTPKLDCCDLFSKYPERSMLRTSWTESAFIGIHDWNEHGDWRTIHGQTLTEAGYSKFSRGEPNNAAPGQCCGAIFRSGLLDDMWCDSLAAFICEKSRGHPEA